MWFILPRPQPQFVLQINVSDALWQKNVRLQKHEFKVAQKNKLVCAVWKDTRVVIMLSNGHKPEALF